MVSSDSSTTSLAGAGGRRRARRLGGTRLPLLLGALVLWCGLGPAHAQPSRQPLLHEFIAPNPRDDLDAASLPKTDALPPEMDTPSGRVTPPDPGRTPEPSRVYRPEEDPDSVFRPDRDTRRPRVEHYDDPFSPSLTPFKRLHAYNAVRLDYTLHVREFSRGIRYQPVPIGGSGRTQGAYDGDDRFFGDMTVELQGATHVRIPTVGPAARLLELVIVPDVPATVWRDSADNWYVKAERSQRARLIAQLAIPRDTFGSAFADVSWEALPRIPQQPVQHRRAYRKVAGAIGISRAMRPRAVVEKMVAYFRSFRPSDESPNEHKNIYLDLALSQKGVCRHRAFAFLVTALNIGLPARLAANEAHAWVEAYDGSLWHRIDLGGAVSNLADEPQLDRPPHVPPPDPYQWPTGRDSGEDLANRHRREAIERRLGAAGSEPPPAPGTGGGSAAAAPPPTPTAAGGGAPDDERPPSTVTIESIDRDIFRGYPLHIKGQVQPCPQVRVDIVVFVEGEEQRIGSLSTDLLGRFDGALVVPRDLPVGDHQLIVTTEGNAECGPGVGM